MSRSSEDAFFTHGMTDALITELSRYKDLRVTSRTSVMRYEGVRPPLPEIARELGVSAVLEGMVLRDGDSVRVSVQLIRAATDDNLWAEAYERDLRDVLGLQREIARTVAREVRIRTALRRDDPPPGSVDPTAYALYLRGRYLWDEHRLISYGEALAFFERSIALAPSFAPAYSGLADVYVHLYDSAREPPHDARARALEYARHALELDATLAEAHTSIAHVLMHDENWEEAEKAYRRALELNPSYVNAHVLYSFHLAAQGRFGAAIDHTRDALALDPLSARTHSFAGYVYYFARRYDEAITHWQRMVELYPDDPGPYLAIAQAYVAMGAPQEAIAWAERAGSRRQESLDRWHLAYAYAAAGLHEEARALLNSRIEGGGSVEADPLEVAAVYARLGESDSALEWLEQAMRIDHGWTMFLGVEPAYDSIRSDPRFKDLLRLLRLK